MTGLCTIKSDVFDIARRLKEIDSHYFVVYSQKKRRFEVHNSRQKRDSLCVVVPYSRLDARTVLLVKRTRIARIKQVLADMERDNQRLEKQAAEQAIKDAMQITESVLCGKRGF